MEWLAVMGVICFLGGAFFLSSDEVLHKVGDVFNQPIAFIDSRLSLIRIPAGIVLVIAGSWIVSVAFSYQMFWYLHSIGALSLFFGLLYLFLPRWLEVFSRVADQLLFSTDELVLGARKSFGVVLVIVSFYIFYAVSQAR